MYNLQGVLVVKDDTISLLTKTNDPNEEEKCDGNTEANLPETENEVSTNIEALEARNNAYKNTAIVCVSLAIAVTFVIGGLSLIAVLTHSNVFHTDGTTSHKVFKTHDRGGGVWKSVQNGSDYSSESAESESSEEIIHIESSGSESSEEEIHIFSSEEIVVWPSSEESDTYEHGDSDQGQHTSTDSEEDWSNFSESEEENEIKDSHSQEHIFHSEENGGGLTSSESEENDFNDDPLEFADCEELLGSSSEESKNEEPENVTLTQKQSCKGDTANVSVCTDETCVQLAADMQASMNESYDPCENFYKFSCAGWIDSHPVLNNASEQLDVLQMMDVDNMNILKTILEDQDAIAKSEAERKARDFYVSCINQDTDKSLNSDEDNDSDFSSAWNWMLPNHTDIDRYSIIKSHAKDNKFNYHTFMQFIPPQKNYLRNHNGKSIPIQMKSAGTTLPQDHYFEDNELKKNILVDYHEYLTQIRNLADDELDQNELRDEMKAIIEFEKKLAFIQPKPTEEKTLHLNVKQMANLIPYPPWKKSFRQEMNLLKKKLSVKLSFALSSSDKEYLTGLKTLFKHHFKNEEGRKALKNHLSWNSLKSRVNFFEHHAPRSTLLKNALGLEAEAEPIRSSTDKSDKCTKETLDNFPAVTGRLFVLEAFSSETEHASRQIFKNIKHTFKNHISHATWVDSKSEVTKKLSALSTMNGYPDSIMDLDEVDYRYHAVVISNDTYKANLQSLNTNDLTRKILNYVNNEVNVIEANAFYNSRDDVVEIPAGIIQEPIFNAPYPKIIAYAKLGFVMGHEISHAFQKYYYSSCSSTCEYNTDDPRKCVEDFYNNFRVNNKFMVNGKATVEENFADIAGIKVAYDAYNNHYCEEYQSLPGLEKYTRDQLFFIASAQVHCRSMGSKVLGDKITEDQVNEDTHSPNSVRVTGALTNTKEFAEAFSCPQGSLYNLADKCVVF